MESKIQQIKEKIVIKMSDNLELVSKAKSEELNKYGLSNFVQAVLKEEVINLDFVTELIASYNPKKHTAKISGRNLYVTKDALTAALILPETINVNVDEDDEDAIDFDDEEVEEYARFLHDFVLTYMYLNSEQKVAVVAKVHQMCDCLMSGHPKDFDFSGFMWVLVENEILKGTDIQDCYYAQHMQCLIRDQLSDLFGGGDDQMDDYDAGGSETSSASQTDDDDDDDDDGGSETSSASKMDDDDDDDDDDAGGSETRRAPVESQASGSGPVKNRFKEVYQRRRRNNVKGGTASGSGSSGRGVNSGSSSGASSSSDIF